MSPMYIPSLGVTVGMVPFGDSGGNGLDTDSNVRDNRDSERGNMKKRGGRRCITHKGPAKEEGAADY